MHWTRSSCDHLSFSDAQIETLTGLLMGDADLHARADPNPLFRIRMTNRHFLEYLDSRLGVLSRGVFLDRTAQEMAAQAKKNQERSISGFETVNEDNYNDLFGLRTVSHPDLHQFKSWYRSGEKRFPEELELTPEITRMWYICDGWLAVDSKSSDGPRLMFKASNERDRRDYLVNLFEDARFIAGFSRDSIQVSAFETERLLKWMGDPPAGFRYKWELPDST